MAKRKRRTKAEMIAARAAKAQQNAEKYLERIAKKQEQSTNVSAIVPLKNNTMAEDDTRQFEFCEFLGTQEECVNFMKTNHFDWIGTSPYLYAGSTYRVTYWKEKI